MLSQAPSTGTPLSSGYVTSWLMMGRDALVNTHRLCNLVEMYIINSALSLMFLELNYVEVLEVTAIDPLCLWCVKLKREVAKISSFGKQKENNQKK